MNHARYEFVIETTKEVYAGETLEEVYEKFAQKENVTELQPGPDGYDEFFRKLQDDLTGTWKWYDGKINTTHWLMDYRKHAVVRRVGKGNRDREKCLKNLEKANEVRRSNPEKLHEQAVKAGKAGGRAGGLAGSREAKRAAALARLANLSPEERSERMRKMRGGKNDCSNLELKDNPNIVIVRIEEFLHEENPKSTNIIPLTIGRGIFMQEHGEHDVDILLCRSKPSAEWKRSTCRQAQHYIRRAFMKPAKQLAEFGEEFKGHVFIEKE